MEGLRALPNPLVNPFLKAEAAVLVGVLGVVGSASDWVLSFCSRC